MCSFRFEAAILLFSDLLVQTLAVEFFFFFKSSSWKFVAKLTTAKSHFNMFALQKTTSLDKRPQLEKKQRRGEGLQHVLRGRGGNPLALYMTCFEGCRQWCAVLHLLLMFDTRDETQPDDCSFDGYTYEDHQRYFIDAKTEEKGPQLVDVPVPSNTVRKLWHSVTWITAPSS